MIEKKNLQACSSGNVAQWDRRQAVLNQALMALNLIPATYALARRKPRKLPAYLILVALFTTLWRKKVCARCQYYGQHCATLLGILTSKIMLPDRDKSLDARSMIMDFLYIGLLAVFPLREVLASRRLAFLYCASLMVGILAIILRACPICGNDFCPLWKLAHAVRD